MDIEILTDCVKRARDQFALIEVAIQSAEVEREEHSYLLRYAERDAHNAMECINELLETLGKLK